MVTWIVAETHVPADTHPLSHMHSGAGPWQSAPPQEVIDERDR